MYICCTEKRLNEILFNKLRKGDCVQGDRTPPLRRAQIWFISFKAPRNKSFDAGVKIYGSLEESQWTERQIDAEPEQSLFYGGESSKNVLVFVFKFLLKTSSKTATRNELLTLY